MRSAVRFAVSSVSIAPVLQLLRSGGISVDSYQRPLAKRKKSSPGFTLGSMPFTSSPRSGAAEAVRSAPAGPGGFEGADEQATMTARTAELRPMATHPATLQALAAVATEVVYGFLVA